MLWEVANSLNLDLSMPINLVPTWYTDNSQDLNLVLDVSLSWVEGIQWSSCFLKPS